MHQCVDMSVRTIDLIPIPRIEQRIDAVDSISIEEGEACATEMMLVLKKGDLVTVAAPVEIGEKLPVEAVRPRSEHRRRPKQRIVQHDSLEAKRRQAAGKPE